MRHRRVRDRDSVFSRQVEPSYELELAAARSLQATDNHLLGPLARASLGCQTAGRVALRNIDIEWPPAYAPELNPVEPRWGHTKHGDLANFVPDDTLHLKRNVHSSLRKQHHD